MRRHQLRPVSTWERWDTRYGRLAWLHVDGVEGDIMFVLRTSRLLFEHSLAHHSLSYNMYGKLCRGIVTP